MKKSSNKKVNPSLKALKVLVGDWEIEISNASFLPDRTSKVNGKATFEWTDEQDFLIMRMGDRSVGPPYSNCVIGRDEAEAETSYTVLYTDDRKVSRIYQMSFENNIWKQWRNAPGFLQRFTANIAKGGNTITGAWENSNDGVKWEHDFDIAYKRAN